MKSTSILAISVGLLASAALAATPATAQNSNAAAAQPAQWAPTFAKGEAEALQPVETAIAAKDWAAASAAVATAQAAVSSPDARYYLGQTQLEIGTATNNPQLQAQGLDAMIASGGGNPAQAAVLHRNRGRLALQAKDYARAETAYARWAALAPNDPEAQVAVAETKLLLKKPQEALPLLEKAIAARQAAGQQIPERLYLLALQSALDAKAAPQVATLSRGLLQAYPNAKNWRNSILIYRQSTNLDPTLQIDTLRLMRAAKALDRTEEYLTLADLLARGLFYAEAKAVLDEGARSGKLPASNAEASAIARSVSSKVAEDRAALAGLEARARSAADGTTALRVAEGYYGHGEYAKAAEFYRTALEKGSVDSNLVNTRLGMALAQAGRKAEAEAAFKAVTGPRAGLANLWLLWGSQPA